MTLMLCSGRSVSHFLDTGSVHILGWGRREEEVRSVKHLSLSELKEQRSIPSL